MSRKRRIARQKNVFRRADYPDAYCDVKWEEYPDQDLVNFTVDIFDGTSISWLGKRSTLKPVVYQYKSEYLYIGKKLNDDGSYEKSTTNRFKLNPDSPHSVYKYIRDDKHEYNIMEYDKCINDDGVVDQIRGWWQYSPCSYINKILTFSIRDNRWILSFENMRYFKKRGTLKKELMEVKLDLASGEIIKFCSLKRDLDNLSEVMEVLASNGKSETPYMKKEVTKFEKKTNKTLAHPFVPDNAVHKAIYINGEVNDEKSLKSAYVVDTDIESWITDIKSYYTNMDNNCFINIYPYYKNNVSIEKKYLNPELEGEGIHTLTERWNISKDEDGPALTAYYIESKINNLCKRLSYDIYKDDKGAYQSRLQYIYLIYFDNDKDIRALRSFQFDDEGFVKRYKDKYSPKKNITLESSIENIKNSLSAGSGEIEIQSIRYETDENGIRIGQTITNVESYKNDERKLRVPDVLRLSNTYNESGNEYISENLIANIIASELSEDKFAEWKEIIEDAKSRN